MRALRILGAALLWVIGVGAVAATASVAINSAGEQVVARTVSAASADGGVDPLAGLPAPSATTPAPVQSTSASLAPATGTTSPAPSRTRVPVSPSTPAGGAAGTPSPQSSTAVTTRAPQPTANPVSDQRTTVGGSVWVECTGPVVTDSVVQPGDGWSAHSGLQGPGTLVASFVRNTSRIDVNVTCTGGQPHFSVSSHGGGDD
jgi:hypothetical protein